MFQGRVGGVKATHHRHLHIAKLGPEVLDGVEPNEGSHEQSHQLDTSHKTDAKTSHEQPEEPRGLEAILALTVELDPAEGGGHSSEQEHRVEEDETANRGVRVFAEDHESDEPHGGELEVKLLSRPVRHGYASSTPEGVELAHESVVELLGVCLAGLELERSIVPSQVPAEPDQKFTGGGLPSSR